MKLIRGRLALLAAVIFAAATGAVACVEAPVEPATVVTASESTPSFGKTKTAPVCENLVYPISLCWPYTLEGEPGQRDLLCSALRTGTPTFAHPVSGRPATQVFAKVYSTKYPTLVTGSQETVTIPRGDGVPDQVLYFNLTTAQIEGEGMCKGNPGGLTTAG